MDHSHAQSWIHDLMIVCLLLACLPFSAEGSCRTSNNEPICCQGKQSHCYGFEIDWDRSTFNNRGFNRSALARLGRNALPSGIKMKRCFCDDSCVSSKDCCADYRNLCEKPSKLAHPTFK
ncbi:hypothetical protein Ciccas_006880 [Cichlidogyrus casuarinus]|uniref:SMB domain-containing protein n=1 Tax=Cichlidogyrus casuarinus TaxID=1844966 RepID=A0ABD2Q5S0_9PLAT